MGVRDDAGRVSHQAVRDADEYEQEDAAAFQRSGGA